MAVQSPGTPSLQMEEDVSNSYRNLVVHERYTALAWTPEAYDGETHYADLLKALSPALFILAVAAALMLAIL